MAPEVLRNENHGFSVDFYAVGIITYEFLFGHRPYLAKTKKEVKELILTHQARVSPDELPNGWSEDVADFINQLIQRKPKNRLGFYGINKIKEHPWIQDFDWESLQNRKLKAHLIPKKGDNFDKKYCGALDKIGSDTIERYQNYLLDRSYDQKFKNFSSMTIPEEFKRSSSLNPSQSVTSQTTILTTNLNTNTKTILSRNQKESIVAKNIPGNSDKNKDSIVATKGSSFGMKENTKSRLCLNDIKKKSKKILSSSMQDMTNLIEKTKDNDDKMIEKIEKIIPLSHSQSQKKLKESDEQKSFRRTQSKLVLGKKLPIINISLAKKNKNHSSELSFLQLKPMSGQQSERKFSKSKMKLRSQILGATSSQYFLNGNISHIHNPVQGFRPGNNKKTIKNLNRSGYNSFKLSSKSISNLSYFG